MKGLLFAVVYGFILFGASLYCGTLWALHFFWFPTWRHLTVGNYWEQFIPQTQSATEFFTVVVPLAFFCNLVLIWKEWKGLFRWYALVPGILLATTASMSQFLILPINKSLTPRAVDPAFLTSQLERWMMLNDIRLVITTVMWVSILAYFIAKGGLIKLFGAS